PREAASTAIPTPVAPPPTITKSQASCRARIRVSISGRFMERLSRVQLFSQLKTVKLWRQLSPYCLTTPERPPAFIPRDSGLIKRESPQIGRVSFHPEPSQFLARSRAPFHLERKEAA